MMNAIKKIRNTLKSKSGFSIVELLVALALLLIALGLGYNLMFFARNSFNRSEERWMEQNEVVAISNMLYDALNEAYYVAIVADKASIPSDIGFYGAFYTEGGKTVYQHSDGSVVATGEVPGDRLTLLFSKATYSINEVSYPYNDLINVSVTSYDLNYNISTQVHLNNMNRERAIYGDDSGPVIVFQTKEVVETVPDDIYGSLCFIATAAYDSPMKPAVRLLRRFRDEILLETSLGSRFVDFYYENSPPIAAVISENTVLRFLTRAALYPLVGLVSLVMNPLHLMCVLVGLLLTIIVFRKKYGPNSKRINL